MVTINLHMLCFEVSVSSNIRTVRHEDYLGVVN